jgi:hypothetical protein
MADPGSEIPRFHPELGNPPRLTAYQHPPPSPRLGLSSADQIADNSRRLFGEMLVLDASHEQRNPWSDRLGSTTCFMNLPLRDFFRRKNCLRIISHYCLPESLEC